MTDDAPATANAADPFVLTTSRGFTRWLAGIGGSLAFTTYQAGKVFMLGLRPDGRLSVHERTFPRAMGLGVGTDGGLLLATEYQIWQFDDVMIHGRPAPNEDRPDALYAPHRTWVTGDVDVHDIGFGVDGEPLFVATLLNCIATVSDGFSLKPIWQPQFVSRIAPEDRCHLNGMAMAGGRARYATAVSRSDVSDGWRDRRTDGGVVIDVDTNVVVAEGLSMPHSPRLARGADGSERLWLLESGAGWLGSVDLQTGAFERLAFCPGYARGLALVGPPNGAPTHAVVGLSLARENRTFQGLPLDDALAERDADARCGLLVVDLSTGSAVEWVRIEGVVRELFDVAVLSGVRRPTLIGTKGNEIRTVIAIDQG